MKRSQTTGGKIGCTSIIAHIHWHNSAERAVAGPTPMSSRAVATPPARLADQPHLAGPPGFSVPRGYQVGSALQPAHVFHDRPSDVEVCVVYLRQVDGYRRLDLKCLHAVHRRVGKCFAQSSYFIACD